MRRRIITIDEEKCDGCGLCIPGCPEGALEIVDGKARLVSDFYCDGLGACIGDCPKDAISVTEREAETYDERKAIENIARKGSKAVEEHLRHLEEHKEEENLAIARAYLAKHPVKEEKKMNVMNTMKCGCPGSTARDFTDEDAIMPPDGDTGQPSRLRQWPVQLHLVSPMAPYFRGRDVVLAADCVAYALGNFHSKYLSGKSLAIACPKLDGGQGVYREKLASLMDDAGINTLTVITMEVPCCSGLVRLAKSAADDARRKVPIKSIVISIRGEIVGEEWLS